MKVCFYLNNDKINDVDLSNPHYGNPGIGGTQYMILSISYYFKKMYPSVEVYIAAPNIEKLPKNIISIHTNNIIEAAIACKNKNIDIFIFQSIENKELYNQIDLLRLNSIAWAHNFPTLEELKQVSECKFVKRYLTVSQEQLNMLEDHEIIRKSHYIHNGIDLKLYEDKFILDADKKENIICYLGSLVPEKGFHILAKNWRYIKKKVPNAKLYIIGSGKLYNRNAKLGKYGIAEEKYEKRFIKYLLNENKEIDKDVIFWGVLDHQEKLKVMSKAKVGIVNPSGKTETFCISAIEFQLIGVPVVTIAKNALVETVKHKHTGYLSGSKAMLKYYIVKILTYKDNRDLSENAILFVKDNFDIYKIIKDWYKLFQDILFDNNEVKKYSNTSILKNYKWLIKINKTVKKISFLSNTMSIYEYAKSLKLLTLKIKSIVWK